MIKVNDKFKTKNNGACIVTKYDGAHNITVQFEDTGHVTVVQSANLRLGNVKDPMRPKIHGVGYEGIGRHRPTCIMDGKSRRNVAYGRWYGMLERCYCPKFQAKNPTYKGCKVDERWHNFQNFAEWHEEHYFEGAQLDKDLSAYGERGKLYSPETCVYVTRQVNNEEAQAKHFVFTSPQGERVEIYNLKKFSEDNGLNYRNMHATYQGKQRSHRGWTKA